MAFAVTQYFIGWQINSELGLFHPRFSKSIALFITTWYSYNSLTGFESARDLNEIKKSRRKSALLHDKKMHKTCFRAFSYHAKGANN